MVEGRIRSRPSDKQLCNNVQQNTQDTRQEQSPSTVAESAVLTWNIGDWHVCSKSAAAQCDHRYDYGAREGERSELQVILSQTYGTQLRGCHQCQPVPDVQMARDEGTFFEVVWVSRWNP